MTTIDHNFVVRLVFFCVSISGFSLLNVEDVNSTDHQFTIYCLRFSKTRP
jgi:hypothetical protein